LWPSAPCTNADPNDGHSFGDNSFCNPCADPDAGMAFGSGINPNFPVTCAPIYDPRDPLGRGGACAALQSDPNNCGACGSPCATGQVCVQGACGDCPKGTKLCAPSDGSSPGSCTNTATDATNCGACGTACDTGKVCSGGKCVSTCGAGTT